MSVKQRLNEWKDNFNDDYFNRQFEQPYRSTVKFCDWLESLGLLNPKTKARVIDIGTGKGANLHYMNKRFPNVNYLGIDVNHDFVREGNLFFKKQNLGNCNLEYGNLYELDLDKHKNKFDGLVSYQTLSWLPEYEVALKNLIKLNTDWIALTSLFYDGLVDCKIELNEFENSVDKTSSNSTFYNIYSLPRIKNFFKKNGFKKFEAHQFEIDIDLPKPKHSHMQTYTQKLENGKRQQISGPLLMNWYFVCAAKH